MSLYSFLASLPAILALVGFVIYLFIGRNRQGDAVTKKIVDKIRVAAPEETKKYEGLRGRQIEQAIKADQGIRKIITEGDLKLLEQALKQQFIENLVVYGICGAIFCLGVIGFYDSDRRAIRLAAMIDQILIQDYVFEAKALVWTKGSPPEVLSFGGTIHGM